MSLTKEETTRESLPGGPKLTGLALVEHGGKIYRAGGFTAKNKHDEDRNLWSLASFACHDPAGGQWTDLVPLPSGRSSLDAANNRLVITTKSGSVQALNVDGSALQIAGQSTEARFFHRQLTTRSGQILLIAGASMQSGRTETLELLQMVFPLIYFFLIGRAANFNSAVSMCSATGSFFAH